MKKEGGVYQDPYLRWYRGKEQSAGDFMSGDILGIRTQGSCIKKALCIDSTNDFALVNFFTEDRRLENKTLVVKRGRIESINGEYFCKGEL